MQRARLRPLVADKRKLLCAVEHHLIMILIFVWSDLRGEKKLVIMTYVFLLWRTFKVYVNTTAEGNVNLRLFII